jgi:hypothetical protein
MARQRTGLDRVLSIAPAALKFLRAAGFQGSFAHAKFYT